MRDSIDQWMRDAVTQLPAVSIALISGATLTFYGFSLGLEYCNINNREKK